MVSQAYSARQHCGNPGYQNNNGNNRNPALSKALSLHCTFLRQFSRGPFVSGAEGRYNHSGPYHHLESNNFGDEHPREGKSAIFSLLRM